jgi:hypothetical protein
VLSSDERRAAEGVRGQLSKAKHAREKAGRGFTSQPPAMMQAGNPTDSGGWRRKINTNLMEGIVKSAYSVAVLR